MESVWLSSAPVEVYMCCEWSDCDCLSSWKPLRTSRISHGVPGMLNWDLYWIDRKEEAAELGFTEVQHCSHTMEVCILYFWPHVKKTVFLCAHRLTRLIVFTRLICKRWAGTAPKCCSISMNVNKKHEHW